MGLFDLLRAPDINAGVTQYQRTDNAVLLDVRMPEEYRKGHIPGSVNVPLHKLQQIENRIVDRQRPLFAYCLSGARSRQAVNGLRRMGYVNVTNIGGIGNYNGEIER